MNTSEWFNAWAEPWASFMSRSTIDSALVFGLVGLVWLALRKRLSAQVGYLLFLLVLVKLILPGVISLPGLIHAWLPAPEAVTAGTGDDNAWWRFGRLRGDGGGAPVPASAPIGSVVEREDAAGLSLAAWLMLGWAVAVAVMVFRFGEYQWFLSSWMRRIQPVKGKAWQAEMEDLSHRAGLHQTVPCKTAFWLESPAVWGFRHPVILVPPGFTRRFSREQIRWILLHEMAHVRRATHGRGWRRGSSRSRSFSIPWCSRRTGWRTACGSMSATMQHCWRHRPPGRNAAKDSWESPHKPKPAPFSCPTRWAYRETGGLSGGES